MTELERFIDTLCFRPVDRPPFMEIAAWEQTMLRWKREGLPESAANADLFSGNDFFHLEGYDAIVFNMTYPQPPYEERIIHEDERYVKFSDGTGRVRLALKEGTEAGMRMSMDTYIDFPVKSRKDFLTLKRGYERHFKERYPHGWEELKARFRSRMRPVTLFDAYMGTFGFYSMLRNWMGTERLSYFFYDEPDLIHECVEFLYHYIVELFDEPLASGIVDFYYIHEDMAGKSGPLMSPDLFRAFILPWYTRFVDFLKRKGVRVVIVDTDGNFEALVPVFLDAGVDAFGPIERAAGMDPVRFRKKYGKRFAMIGGFDKRALIEGKDAIDEEMRRSVLPILEQGGFIPTVDHSIPPDVPLNQFMYYLERKWAALTGAF